MHQKVVANEMDFPEKTAVTRKIAMTVGFSIDQTKSIGINFAKTFLPTIKSDSVESKSF